MNSVHINSLLDDELFIPPSPPSPPKLRHELSLTYIYETDKIVIQVPLRFRLGYDKAVKEIKIGIKVPLKNRLLIKNLKTKLNIPFLDLTIYKKSLSRFHNLK